VRKTPSWYVPFCCALVCDLICKLDSHVFAQGKKAQGKKAEAQADEVPNEDQGICKGVLKSGKACTYKATCADGCCKIHSKA